MGEELCIRCRKPADYPGTETTVPYCKACEARDLRWATFEKEPDYPAPLPSDLQARFNGAVVIPFNYVPKEAPVADAISITTTAAPAALEPTSSKKAIVAKGASAVVALAVLAQVLLPSGLWDTLAAAVEFIARQFAG